MPVLSASDLFSASRRHRAQQNKSQGSLPRTDSNSTIPSSVVFRVQEGTRPQSHLGFSRWEKGLHKTPGPSVGRLEDEDTLHKGRLQGSLPLERVHPWIVSLPGHNHHLGKRARGIRPLTMIHEVNPDTSRNYIYTHKKQNYPFLQSCSCLVGETNAIHKQ